MSRPAGLDSAALFAPLQQFGKLALAVSGGPDSLALMLLAHEHARATGTLQRFVVLSVDHGLRPEAKDEVAFVLREAERLGFAARGLRWEGSKPRTGIQQAARTARYRLLAEAMRRDGAEALVTAHHMGDQAETVLMRLAHGSGIEGLRGMDPIAEIDGLRVVRPLLAVDPVELRALVDAAGLVPVADPSNADLDYERVRWRQMLPRLAALGLDARRLSTFALRMREAEDALARMTEDALSRVHFAEDGAAASIERATLAGLPRAVAVRVVGRMLDRVGGGRKPHALGQVEDLTGRLLADPLRTTLHGCLVRGSRKAVRIEREPGRRAAPARRKEPATS